MFLANVSINYTKLQVKLEVVVVVASALGDMFAESRLAVVSRSLPRKQTFVENQYGGCPHVVSYNIIIFVPNAGTLPYLMVFLNSTFQLQQFPRYQGSQIYIRRLCAPGCHLAEKNFVPKASTLPHQIVFLISTFQLQQFPR